MIDRDEAFNETLKYFDGDELAAKVFEKYALRDQNGNLLEKTPLDTHQRCTSEFFRIEQKYPNSLSEEEISSLLSGWVVVPQGSPMSAIGNSFQLQSLSNCFVVPQPHDSYAGILSADQNLVQIMKRRGGVGIDISTIRPRGMKTTNAAGTTDGIGVFMERFSNSCREVAQGGRRGALMITIDSLHPDLETFINIKKDKKKVTGANVSVRVSDEFMNAVKNDSDIVLRWPVDVPPENAKFTRTVNAKVIWNQLVEANWESAEPGILFWDTMINNSMSDIFADKGFRTISTNPCFTGDTKVAIANGKDQSLTFKELADQGDDVLVYCVNEKNHLSVKLMRNPRKTGEKVPVFRVTIEGGNQFKATENHEMLLRDGTKKRVSDLVKGDQLWTAYKVKGKFCEAIQGMKATQSQNYWWLTDCSRSTKSHWSTEHRMIWKYFNNDIPENHTIHHIDFNALNNQLENLQCMTKQSHDELHANLMCGLNNPIFKIKADSIRFKKYRETLSLSLSGLNNPRAFEIDNDELFEIIVNLTKERGHKISASEWSEFASENSLPRYLNKFRTNNEDIFLNAAIQAKIDPQILNFDPRTTKMLAKAKRNGYVCHIIDHNQFQIERTCEWCKSVFHCSFDNREIAFCSSSHAQLYVNKFQGKNVKRAQSIQKVHFERSQKNRELLLNEYTKLRLQLGREPRQSELNETCKTAGIPFRTGTKFGFKDWNDIRENAQIHNHRVVSVEFYGYEDVYNGTVDEYHNFCIALGEEKLEKFQNPATLFVGTKNCGEIGLNPLDSCRLLLINLVKFVKFPFTKKTKFDFIAFGQVVRKAQRLMDDLVDLEVEAIDKIIIKIQSDPEPESIKTNELNLWRQIKDIALQGRRTGLGITGLGDAIAYLNVKYGSDESIRITEEIYKTLALNAHAESVNLAKERGSFGICDINYYERNKESNPFLKRLIENSSYETNVDFFKHGRRNIALTTTAPAGSMSIMTQTTSGCEPVFMLSYKRRKKINPNDVNVQVDFTDEMGDKWSEFNVYHHGLKLWMDVTGETDLEKSPYFGATSADVDWMKTIELQSVAQKWIEHSISKTTNLPNQVTKEMVSDLYFHAWKLGCKGMTIYRDGSRSGVLIENTKSADDKNLVIVDNHAPKRPRELQCDIHRTVVKGEQYLVLVGLLGNRPYEIFCGLSQNIEIPKKKNKGLLVKNGKNKEGISTYNLKIPLGDDDEILIKNVIDVFDNPLYGTFTRSLSLSLRHGVPVHYICEQLKKDKHVDITSFASAISRILSKNYIVDGTKVTIEKECSECKSTNMAYQGGCVTCMDCGNSRC